LSATRYSLFVFLCAGSKQKWPNLVTEGNFVKVVQVQSA